jgi:hypothetical protein
MTYKLQVAIDTNRDKTPQKIIDQIFANRQYLKKIDDFHFFEFNLIDFQHAIEILSDFTPSEANLKPYIKHAKADLEELSSLSEYFRKFDHEDLKRNTMENIGVGIASLFMNTSFKIDWRDMSHIPKEHFPKGKREKKADFIGYSADLRYYFEAKGSTSANYVKKGMEKAKAQLENIQYTAETKIALVIYIPCDHLDFPPTLFVSDPSIETGIDLDINMVRMLHYQKILRYSGFSTTLLAYSKLVREIIKNKQTTSDRKARVFSEMPVEKNLSRVHSAFEKESATMERRKINNLEFLGKSDQYRTDDGIYTFFRGVDYNIIKKAVVLEYGIKQLHDDVILDEGKASIFSDGTVLAIEYDNKSKNPVKGLPEKPDPLSSSLMRSLAAATTFQPLTDYSKFKSQGYAEQTPAKKVRNPIMIRR